MLKLMSLIALFVAGLTVGGTAMKSEGFASHTSAVGASATILKWRYANLTLDAMAIVMPQRMLITIVAPASNTALGESADTNCSVGPPPSDQTDAVNFARAGLEALMD